MFTKNFDVNVFYKRHRRSATVSDFDFQLVVVLCFIIKSLDVVECSISYDK